MSRLREVAGGRRALLVGFEEPFALAAAAALSDAGWTAERVGGGREALSRWAEVEPELLVTNLDAGDMDALEFLQAIGPAARPAVLACCGAAAGADADAAALAELGIDALVVRPCRVDALAAAAERLVASAPAPAALTAAQGA